MSTRPVSAHLVVGANLAKLVKAAAVLGDEQQKLVSTGQVYQIDFLGAISLPTTTIDSQPFVINAAERLEAERCQSPKKVLLIVAGDTLEVWALSGFDQLVSIQLLQIEFVGAVEGRFEPTFTIIYRHKTGVLMSFLFNVTDDPKQISGELGRYVMVEARAKGLKTKSNPFKRLAGSSMVGGGKAVKEVLEDTPWFVGKTARADVEKALEVGLVGDYVIRESASTAGAYVFVLKLSPTEFIEQKIKKKADGKFAIVGNKDSYATLGELIRADVRATRPAKGVVLGEKIQTAGGGIARRASVTAARSQGKLDIQTDIKAYDAIYLGCQQVYDGEVDGIENQKQIVKKCVVENSKLREELRTLKAQGGAAYEAAKSSSKFSQVVEAEPVSIVITPQLIRVVDRLSGTNHHKAFIRMVPFTLEAPSRDGHLDKFAYIQKNQQETVVCHIFNVPSGAGLILAEAISYYIEQAQDVYSAQKIKANNPFAPTGARERAPPRLFQKQVHRADILATKVIGAGQFGEVWLAKQKIKTKAGDRQVMRAVKTLKGAAGPNDRAEFVREAEVMLDFDHANVTCIVGVAVQQPPWLTVLEFMEHGDLRDVVMSAASKGVALLTGELLDMCIQLGQGCGYIASLRLVHMDIAARNCLLGTDNLVKLADFGLTRPMDKGKDYYKLKERLAISIKWCAVEALEKKCFSEKTDVWSFGVTCWEFFADGEVPLKNVGMTKCLQALRAGARCQQPKKCPADVWAAITLCWELDPAARVSFRQILEVLAPLEATHGIPQPRRDIGKNVKEAANTR